MAKKWPLVLGGATVLVVGIAMGSSAGTSETPVPTFDPAPASAEAAPYSPVQVPAPPPSVPAPDTSASVSVSQENALGSAESYLRYTAFSREGLIDQLKFEDYSTADATYAVDNVKVDWNEQAAKKAESYMDYSSFSRSGLIDQLKFEGFTDEQATFGADSVGL